MNILLKQTTAQNKNTLKQLLHAYRQELLNDPSPQPYKYFDSYFHDPTRHAYLITKNDQPIGFALVNQHTLVVENGHTIAEFYITPEHRGKSIGTKAAHTLFKKLSGSWEIRVMHSNNAGSKFWEKIISDFTKKNYQKTTDHKDWHGAIYSFTTNPH